MSMYGDHLARAVRLAQQFGLGRALTFWREALRDPKATQDWAKFVAAHLPETHHDPFLLRPLRPYMRQHFSVATRRALLRDHITAMDGHFTAHADFSGEPGMVVATLAGKNEACYKVHIGVNTSKEGELAFSFCDGAGNMLARLAGSIGHDEAGQAVFWVGGQQGAKPPLGRDEIVRATRDLFGLRPKAALLLAVQAFARALGLTGIRAPGNEGHISQRGFRRLRSKRKIHADYGQFWEEMGGSQCMPEEYSLPITPQARDVAEVKPNKRTEWKRRQAISEDLATQMAARLARGRRV